MICPRCGTENDNKKNFCKSCGNPIASNMVEPIDFGKTQALPVVVKPIEPMSEEEELKNTSVIPAVSEEVVVEKITPDEEEQRRKAMRDELMYTSEMEQVKVNIKQLESVKKPKKKRPIILIIVLVVLFLSSALGITYYLYKKDMLSFVKKEETTTTTTTTTVAVNVDTEIRNDSKEVIYNSTSHTLKYSYEITKSVDAYKPVLKVYLDNKMIGESIIQDNSYNLMNLYDTILKSEIFTIEDQVITGTDKEYCYINIFINNKFYVYILNDSQAIYSNTTGVFSTEDIENIYNNKTSLIKNGAYSYIKEYDAENGIEQISNISNDEVTFADGEIIKGFWK